jgi:AcrR family transcriptional regulator
MARTRAIDFDTKQRAILTHAASVFADMGMEKASMAQIAERSNVSKALLYHYYPSKDALVFGIIQSHLQELDTATAAADDDSAAPPDRLQALIRTVLESYRNADSHHKVQLNGTASLTPDQQAEIRAIERRIVTRFADVLRLINPDLERSMLKPMTMSLFGILNWVYLWFHEDGPISRQDYADAVTALFLGGVKAVPATGRN